MLRLTDRDHHAHDFAQDVGRRLVEGGFYEPEQRRWLPHVTVLRFRTPPRLRPDLPELGEFSPSDAALLPFRPAAERGAVRSDRIRSARRLENVDREQALDVALSQIERQYGKGSVMKMSDQAHVSTGAVSTGALSLDLALGVGGLPRGRIVEIFGPESSGKTTLVYHVIAEAQRQGGICAFIDAEHAMDPVYASRSASTSTSCSCRSPTTASRRSRSPSCSCARAHRPRWRSTPWPR